MNAYPEIKEIMVELGFKEIVNPIMFKTAAKIMTLKKGAKMKNIDLELIKNKFLEFNFILENN